MIVLAVLGPAYLPGPAGCVCGDISISPDICGGGSFSDLGLDTAGATHRNALTTFMLSVTDNRSKCRCRVTALHNLRWQDLNS